MIMPKIDKKFMKIWISVLTAIFFIFLSSFLSLHYFMKISGKNDFKKSGIESGKLIFYNLGCVRCHNIRALHIKGGGMGQDLSNAYYNVKKIYGENINDFLKNPSGMMRFVLMFNHLNKEDRKIIAAELKKAQMKVKKYKSAKNKKGGA